MTGLIFGASSSGLMLAVLAFLSSTPSEHLTNEKLT
jgi:hypothetical protein